MSSTVGAIVVVGSINVDLVVQVQRHPRPGETIHGSGGMMLPGGKGANQAVAAALLGGQVTMIGAVGKDANAEAALSGLRASGTDVSQIATVEGPTGLAVVTVAEDGENSIVVVPGANAELGPQRVASFAELIGGAGIVVCQGEIPRAAIEALPGLVTGRFLHNPAPVMELDPAVFRASDPLVVNEHEAALVLAQLTASARPAGSDAPKEDGAAAASASPDAGGEEPARLVRSLLDAGIASVVLTLGAKGSLLGDADGISAIPAATVRAVDTTGAGDAFIGALATGLSRGQSLRDAAQLASRVGAFAATGHGAQPSFPDGSDHLPALDDTTSIDA